MHCDKIQGKKNNVNFLKVKEEPVLLFFKLMMSLYIAMAFRFQWIYLKEQYSSLKCRYLQYTG